MGQTGQGGQARMVRHGVTSSVVVSGGTTIKELNA